MNRENDAGESQQVAGLQEQIADLQRALADADRLIAELTQKKRDAKKQTLLVKSLRVVRGVVSNDRIPERVRKRSTHLVNKAITVGQDDGLPLLARHTARWMYHKVSRLEARQYQAWRLLHEPNAEALQRMAQENQQWTTRPLVSILLPTYNTDPQYLREAIRSVQDQIYANWELCIADDGSTNPATKKFIAECAATETRIKATFRPTCGGIGAASNSALQQATGEWIATLDHDDVLRPFALHEMLKYVAEHPDADVVYSDQDKLSKKGKRFEVLFKPDWSPELLLGWNYISHLIMIRTQLVAKVGGFSEQLDGSQDHDLLLRTTELARHVGHVQQVLYSWRINPGSTAGDPDAKPEARQSGVRAVEQALQRRNIPGTVELVGGDYHGFYRVRYAIDNPTVDVLIPNKDHVELLSRFIETIEEKTTYSKYRITIIDNNSSDPATLSYLEKTPYQVVRFNEPYHHPRMMQAGVDATNGDFIILANNDMEVISPEWIEAMLMHAQHADVGAVGCHLLFPNGTTQHGGIALGKRFGSAIHLETRWPVAREVGAVTAAATMVKRTVWNEIGGLGELRVAWDDVDFCLRLRRAGYRIIYTPMAQLIHYEGATKGRRHPQQDVDAFLAVWGDDIYDPYANQNVTSIAPLRLAL